jgi:hypothetical protein
MNDRETSEEEKILSDPVSLSARDFFQKRTSEEPMVRRRTRRIEDFGTRNFANYGVRQTLSLHYEYANVGSRYPYR